MTSGPAAYMLAATVGAVLALVFAVTAAYVSSELTQGTRTMVPAVWGAVIAQAFAGYVAGRFLYRGRPRTLFDLLWRVLSPGAMVATALWLDGLSSCPRVLGFSILAGILPAPLVAMGAMSGFRRSEGAGSQTSVRDGLRAALSPVTSPRRVQLLGLGALVVAVGAVAGGSWTLGVPEVPKGAAARTDLWSVTRGLSAWDAGRLEVDLAFAPGSENIRALLLQLYSDQAFSQEVCASSIQRHYGWFVANDPGAPLLRYIHVHPSSCAEASESWKGAGIDDSTDPSALQNAANLASECDAPWAERLLLRAEEIDEVDDDIPGDLGQLYFLHWDDLGLDRTEGLRRALDAYEREAARADEDFRDRPLVSAAAVAADLGDFDHAERLALRALAWAKGRDGRARSVAVHHGHIVLGRVALHRDDVETAKRELLLAADVAGAPTLNSFGPNMKLAKELLDRGESDTVLAYFEGVRSFWVSGAEGTLDRWTATVKRGEMPDFGSNLIY